MNNVRFAGADAIAIGEEDLAWLKEAALQSPLRRARICLHVNHQAQVQEMLIALCQGSYIPPHRHRVKTESYHVVEGEMDVLVLDDAGNLAQRISLGPARSGKSFLFRQTGKMWHTVLPLTPFVLMHETTTGPYSPGETEHAAWAPEPSDFVGIEEFWRRINATKDW
jgi:cupin fold WbuC family metalloprotein